MVVRPILCPEYPIRQHLVKEGGGTAIRVLNVIDGESPILTETVLHLTSSAIG